MVTSQLVDLIPKIKLSLHVNHNKNKIASSGLPSQQDAERILFFVVKDLDVAHTLFFPLFCTRFKSIQFGTVGECYFFILFAGFDFDESRKRNYRLKVRVIFRNLFILVINVRLFFWLRGIRSCSSNSLKNKMSNIYKEHKEIIAQK